MVMLSGQGKYETAETKYRQTLVKYEKVLGKEHPYNLALVLDSQGNSLSS
jgi:hypothetical protein